MTDGLTLQFDANQQFQLDAMAAVTDLFEGQPDAPEEYVPLRAAISGGLWSSQDLSELGVGNVLRLTDEQLRENARTVQDRNDIEIGDPSQPLASWSLFDTPMDAARTCPHFSVEMETGTGKTYVYLRTIFELATRFGFKKYVIVVPSVAIREGVLKNLEITADHFRALYNEEPRWFVYDAKQVSRLREFATSNTLQIQVINIQAFVKNFTDGSPGSGNVIYKVSDKLSGRQPIEYVQAARPIVIIDEPQSVDSTEKSQEAIKALNPLLTLRYSATHRVAYNLLYRLDPVRAFEQRLVKQIVVASAAVEGTTADPFVRVEAINIQPLSARLTIHMQAAGGPRNRTVTVRAGDDLHALSQERPEYADNFRVAEINAEPGFEFVSFTNGKAMRLGEETGGVREDIWRAQIKHTVKRHLDTELRVAARGIKVLTLFFIDRVANYRDVDDAGTASPGKFAQAFEDELAALAGLTRYESLTWLKLPVAELHDGYFAQDKKGYRDTSGSTQADDEAYDLIMKDKERLLSLETPLRFIFSHSALREGWDNPNVFQICTLNETRSPMKKRQEIGRGLRLPVDQHGVRVMDESVNKLYVMANESYEDFAKALQTEYEEDAGITFGKVGLLAIAKLTRVVDEDEVPIGRDDALRVQDDLVSAGMIDADGRILAEFNPARPGFELALRPELAELADQVVDLLSSYRLERYVRRDRDEGPNRLTKRVELDADFVALWNRIKWRTTYRVEFQTEHLVQIAVDALKAMERIDRPRIEIKTGGVEVTRGGIKTSLTGVAEERIDFGSRPIPDILTYLQGRTSFTRSTIVRILKESGRLGEFFNDPERFMDSVAKALEAVRQRLVVDGIKYERVDADATGAEWEMREFKDEELVNYLTSLPVKHSIYERVVYDSEVERKFAQQLDEREDIKLFVKLPRWFRIDTPVGEYNPDWAIVKDDGTAVYLARETKSTKDFLKLRSAEALKVRCGAEHFSALDVDFKVVTAANEV
jgi:type III restriction enzyme